MVYLDWTTYCAQISHYVASASPIPAAALGRHLDANLGPRVAWGITDRGVAAERKVENAVANPLVRGR